MFVNAKRIMLIPNIFGLDQHSFYLIFLPAIALIMVNCIFHNKNHDTLKLIQKDCIQFDSSNKLNK